MTAFTIDGIDELDRLARDSDNVFNMTRGGYVLATRRADVADVVEAIPGAIDIDVISERSTIRETFPALSEDIRNVLHIRRGGDFSSQQLAQYMLEKIRDAGGSRLRGHVTDVSRGQRYALELLDRNSITADIVVNAAGPFVGDIGQMLDVDLALTNVFQQKVAFEDQRQAIPRDMPFSIDLDAKHLGWSNDEAALLAEDAEHAWLTGELPAGTHCRPDGGPNGRWVKLGWAYNKDISEPEEDLANEATFDNQFPEIVMRGAAAFIPALKPYIESPPARFSHYGGYYTMTEENWPIIGPLDNEGAFVIGALSGFGSMAACAAGKLCAMHICGSELPAYTTNLSLERFKNSDLMANLTNSSNKGLL